MNGKQTKMLQRILATKAETKRWKSFPAEKKGKMRKAYSNYDKMAYPSFTYLEKEA